MPTCLWHSGATQSGAAQAEMEPEPPSHTLSSDMTPKVQMPCCWQRCPRTSSASPAPLRISRVSGMRRRQVGYTASTTGTAGRVHGDMGRSGDTEGPLPWPDPLPSAGPRLRVLEEPHLFLRDAPTMCAVSTQRRGANGMRHICVFPSQDVRLFTQLHVLVLDAATNHTRHRRELSVDAVGLIAPPVNISAHWAGATGQLRVSWQPPLADYPNFFLYEVCYHPMTPTVTPRGTAPGDLPAHPTNGAHPPTARGAASSQGTGQGLVQANTWVILRELQPGVKYHIQVRSKPDGTSMDGVWGPWSEVVVAETPHSSGDIGLHCSTPDLRCVRCVWSWDPAEHHSTHELFYQASPSGAGMRDEMWQQCEETSVGTQGRHTCTFQPTAGSPIAVLVNITRLHDPPVLSYFKEPFWLHQAVLTEAPRDVQATAAQGRLTLRWLPPLEALAEQLEYQIRYATDDSLDWKVMQGPARGSRRPRTAPTQLCLQVLQVPRAARKEVLDLRPGARYRAQVRTQPGGPQYRGSWSAWSQPVAVDVAAEAGKGHAGLRAPGWDEENRPALRNRPSVAGWVIPSVTVAPLIFTGVLLGLRCTFPSLYSSVKQKLWPPVPDLHRALGTFLHDSPKQGQPCAFYKQPPEDAVLPCLLEVLPGPRGEPGDPPPEPAASRPAPSTDIANHSYLLMGGWEPRGAPSAPFPPGM
ncbi:thrombopoietin receptor isoform X6 [Lagopus muta]|uniref:thrombopoietin receptor isoform X6 n=1 Tax=Lagopus muta TaxID=64668 RepID=UPI00209DFF54|nr:thrombopoietin receptor isoform X6 [Lagopus muta]